MLEEIMEFLEKPAVLVVSGLCLAASLVFSVLEVAFPVDPAWVSVILSGLPLVHLALWRVVHNEGISKISSALLISVAMVAAAAIGDLFAAGEVAFIMAIGEKLEDLTTARARRGLKRLIGLAPRQGRRLTEAGEETIPAEDIGAGDLLRILPGETVPVDGVVVRGNSSVDQAVITGESLPVDKGEGDEVYGGTVNQFGTLDIRATRVGEDSTLQRLIRMVQEAEEKKAPVERVADKWASWLVPVALLIAVISYIVTRDIVRAVTVLVVFCPCALVLATPTAVMAAIGQAARKGVIIKSGEALEKMGRVDTIAFDKTGTLTLGDLQVREVLSFGEMSGKELFRLAASVEACSEHPLGRAVAAHARENGVAIPETEHFAMKPGRGVGGTVEGRTVLCGSEAYLADNGISLPEEGRGELERLWDEGRASLLVAVDGVCVGVIALSDTLRPETAGVVERLRAMGTRVVLLTGDNRRAATSFARQAGIDDVRAQLLPGDKVGSLEELRSAGRGVCMIGDGVNDAPALKAADVGVAMGGMGSDIAVEAADIALMSDDISRVPYLKRLARAALGTIRFSISLSLLINFAAIILSLAGALTPTTGALVHNAGSVFVVLIAALLYDRKFE